MYNRRVKNLFKILNRFWKKSQKTAGHGGIDSHCRKPLETETAFQRTPNMANGESNGHLTYDITWPWKVKLMISIRLEPNISKTAGDAIRNNR